MESRGEVAKNYMKQGCNCCQSVVMAFPDAISADQQELFALAASFGGGMGYLGLTCGALAGAGMVFGAKFGSDFKGDPAYKKAFYAAVKEMGEEFGKERGALTCDELKRLQKEGRANSCIALTEYAVSLAEKYLEKYADTLKPRRA